MLLYIDKVINHARHFRQALEHWYRLRAEERLREKVARYAKRMGVSPRSVSVKSFKNRWGSCHLNGDIQFHWPIIMAPHYIIDYVVIHELCHLLHHNHSPAFWQCVARYYPDYLECKEWLKANGRRLTLNSM